MKSLRMYFFIAILNTSRTSPYWFLKNHYLKIGKLRNFALYNINNLTTKISVTHKRMRLFIRAPITSRAYLTALHQNPKHKQNWAIRPHKRPLKQICNLRNFAFYFTELVGVSMYFLIRTINTSRTGSYGLAKSPSHK